MPITEEDLVVSDVITAVEYAYSETQAESAATELNAQGITSLLLYANASDIVEEVGKERFDEVVKALEAIEELQKGGRPKCC